MNTFLKYGFIAVMAFFLLGAGSLVYGIMEWFTEGFNWVPFVVSSCGFTGYLLTAVIGSRIHKNHYKRNREE